MPEPQVVDPEVSRAKFGREIANYRSIEADYRRNGWFLVDAVFPEVFVVFCATKVKPAAVVAAVVLDFTDYDLRPPSVTFVDPFTREPLKHKELNFSMARRQQVAGPLPAAGMQMMPQVLFQISDMIQANGPDDRPFLCLPGVREYHDNPAHTGDSWLLHRTSGEGSLAFILDKIWTYGVKPLQQYRLEITVAGLVAPPEAIAE